MTLHLPSLIYGALAAAALYTFAPVLAEKPSAWLRRAWAWLKAVVGRIGVRRDAE